MTYKVILHAILRQLLTLSTGMKQLLTLATGVLKKKSINRTIPVVVPTMNPIIDQRIAPIVLAQQTLLIPLTK